MGQVTRLDLAIDDIGSNYYTMSNLHDLFSNHSYTSKFRGWREYIDHDNNDACAGFTFYMGSPKSDIMLRIYDKKMEQNKQLLSQRQTPILYDSIRWELQLRGSYTKQAISLLRSGSTIS